MLSGTVVNPPHIPAPVTGEAGLVQVDAAAPWLVGHKRQPLQKRLLFTHVEKELLVSGLDFYRAEHRRLLAQLEELKDTTTLPAAVPVEVRQAVSDLVVRVRLAEGLGKA